MNTNETHMGLVISCRIWLGIGDDNQTFSKELEFDPDQLESVYQDNKQEES